MNNTLRHFHVRTLIITLHSFFEEKKKWDHKRCNEKSFLISSDVAIVEHETKIHFLSF